MGHCKGKHDPFWRAGRESSRTALNSHQAIIEVSELGKDFGNFRAVDAIDFQVYEGEIFGFLGPNGAGKSTTINMVSTLLRPTRGWAELAGHNVVTDPTGVRQSIGMVFQDPSLDDRLRPRRTSSSMRCSTTSRGASAQSCRAGARHRWAIRPAALACATFSGGMNAPAGDRPRAVAPPQGALPRRADLRARPADADASSGSMSASCATRSASPSS